MVQMNKSMVNQGNNTGTRVSAGKNGVVTAAGVHNMNPLL